MHSVGAKGFDVQSLTPALRNLWLLLISTNFMSLVFPFLLFLNSACQQGWIGNGTLCYKLFTASKLTWENGKKECEKWHTNLVKVDSREENDFIKTNVLATETNDDYWIGLSDSAKEDDWMWTDGTRLGLVHGYKNWGSNQPDNYGNNEDCVVIRRESDPNYSGRWYDQPCSRKKKYICENP